MAGGQIKLTETKLSSYTAQTQTKSWGIESDTLLEHYELNASDIIGLAFDQVCRTPRKGRRSRRILLLHVPVPAPFPHGAQCPRGSPTRSVCGFFTTASISPAGTPPASRSEPQPALFGEGLPPASSRDLLTPPCLRP